MTGQDMSLNQELKQDVSSGSDSSDFYFYTTVLLVFVVILLQVLRYMDAVQQEMIRKIKKESKRQAKIHRLNQEKEIEVDDADDDAIMKEESSNDSINSDELRREIEHKYKQSGQSPSISHDSRLSSNSGLQNLVRQSSQMSQTKQTRMIDSHLHANEITQCKHPIFRICLTGGPCAGKTTALTTLQTVLSQMGFKVLLVPEAATMLMKGGCMIQTHKLSFAEAVKFQINVMKTQMALEDVFTKNAINGSQKTVILCDRGAMDGSAYTDENLWQALLDETAWSTIQLRDRRYEAVIHMVTAADGAVEFYTGENNEARYETVEQAVTLDKKLINAWVGHPSFSIIDNKDGNFQRKIERVTDTVVKLIGIPAPTSFYKKFLLATAPGQFDIQTPKNVKKEIFQVEEVFLLKTSETAENFVRKVGKNDSFIYSHEMRIYQNDERIVKKRQITAREFIEMSEQSKDQSRKALKKFRQCFIFDNQYFMVETFLSLDQQPSLLRIETTKEKKDITIPSFVKVIKEVTHENEYASSSLAKQGWRLPADDKKKIQQAIQDQNQNSSQ